ncbi:MAG: hypothetical protein OXG83_11240 [Acidobacteria bacterium]|nr:hypothetical protein [Acidobacteriota bacterium]
MPAAQTEYSESHYPNRASTPEFESVLALLKNEWAHAEWTLQEFRGLFSDGERLAVLNGVAGPLMVLVQDVLWENLLLRVARLTDPVQTAGHHNLTFQQIPAFFTDQPEKHRELGDHVRAAVHAAEFARDWRNRRIGHRDLEHSLDGQAKPLGKASLQRVDAALAAIHRILCTITSYEQAELLRRVGGSNAADGFYYRTLRLVTAAQFIDGIIDADGTSETTDFDAAREFLEPHWTRPDWKMIERLVELRVAARLFPRQPNLLARQIVNDQRARRDNAIE